MIFYFARFITCISVAVPIRLLVFSIKKALIFRKKTLSAQVIVILHPYLLGFPQILAVWMFLELRNVLLFIDVISFELRYVLLFREVSSTLLVLYDNYFGYPIPESKIPKSESVRRRTNES